MVDSRHSIRIELFNGIRLVVGGEEDALCLSGLPAALLALLALKPERKHDRDELAEALWPDEEASATRRRLREHLYQLRESLQGWREIIQGNRRSIWLSDTVAVSIDVHEFDSLLRRAGESTNEDKRFDLLLKAVALYRGPFAPFLDSDQFNDLRSEYAESYFKLLRALSSLLTERHLEQSLFYAELAVQTEPLCEEVQEDLIRLYARAERYDDARSRYRELKRILKADHGGEPSSYITKFVRSLPASPLVQRRVPPLSFFRAAASPASLEAGRAKPQWRWSRVALTAALLTLVVIAILQPWRRTQAQPPPLTPEQRIAIIQRLRDPGPKNETAQERESRHEKQAEQCVALGEEAYSAWYGRDEQVWIDRLSLIDKDIQESLVWLSKHDTARVVQMSGALTRYWWSIGDLDKNQHWLAFSKDQSVSAHDPTRARALTGLSLSYLGPTGAGAETGIKFARQALKLYRKEKDLWGQAQALRHMALQQHTLGQNVEAIRNYRTALELYKRVGSGPGQALTYQCMIAILPADSSGSATDAERLAWALEESSLYRKIRNPRGVSEGQETLMLTAKQTPIALETRPLLEQVEGECREWLRLAYAQHVVRQQHALWLTLADVALKVDDKHTMAESLPALIGTRPPTIPPLGYKAMMIGAYLRYRHLDLHPETNPVISREFFRSGASTPSELARWNSNVELGHRMSLDDAVRYAMNN